jgi:hypothetical protein
MRGIAVRACMGALCLWPSLACADDTSYTPSYDRPGLGFAPSALPWGGFTWEQGLPSWSLDNTDGTRSSQFTTDTLLRLGVGGDMELQLGTSPFNRLVQRTAGVSQAFYGHGDSSLGLKWAPASSSQMWSWGLLGTVEFPDGANGIRNPERQYTLGATVDQNLDATRSLTYVAQWQRMGNEGAYLAAGNFGYAIDKVWGVYAELAAVHQQGGTGGLFGAGVTYLPNARLQWDLSFDHRLFGQASQWTADFGVSIHFTP